MKIKVERYEFTPNSTIGRLSIDGKELCFTLEDMVRTDKMYGETCIPLGTYEIKLRKAGKMYQDYLKDARVKDFFKGSLHITNIPSYEYVLIHIGNTKKDTLGCILVGMHPSVDRIDGSTDAYTLIYPIILDALESGDKVTIEICNEVS
jgi:hypothetical protein